MRERLSLSCSPFVYRSINTIDINLYLNNSMSSISTRKDKFWFSPVYNKYVVFQINDPNQSTFADSNLPALRQHRPLGVWFVPHRELAQSRGTAAVLRPPNLGSHITNFNSTVHFLSLPLSYSAARDLAPMLHEQAEGNTLTIGQEGAS